ncbi:hypothetical protein [Thermomonospora cellulosilytica]|uniref:Uncharacterized protein n=1 Tax=Thermomonospora cellulosilytica TaxID=1411118 RepID=A0A7W3MX15_9ACTN|nr:hypothetical protein [Thermomonospora cellulosilytica]MBA9003475.1 hypothetical protein [Thermomonospora cellulosilytica]
MDGGERLSEEDYASIHRAGRLLAEQGWGAVVTLNQMMDAWRELVETLEQEEYDSIFAYEWDHDLRCRDWLHTAWPMLTARIQELRAPELQALDDRYRQATVPLQTPDQPSCDPHDPPTRWWHHRRPRVVNTDHSKDLPRSWSLPETPIP